MFSVEERSKIRAELIEMARRDSRISGGAVTGSASVGSEDRWSDIDLGFGVKDGFEISEVLADFTAKMYRDYGALHHLDVISGPWIYRVFLLRSTLQVDIAAVNEASFGARALTFQLIFGKAAEVVQVSPSKAEEIIGWAWLNALHVRSSIARERWWQTEYYINEMRNQVVSLLCLRHGLPEKQARGVDRLPVDVKKRFEATLVRSLEQRELRRAFGEVTEIFLHEIDAASRELRQRLEPTLIEMVGSYDAPFGR